MAGRDTLRGVESGRAGAFSDGVFAIAITLLVLDLRVADAGNLTVAALLHAWPHYFAYVVSFLTIGIMWMNHHSIFAHVVRVDRPLLALNLLLLMVVAVIPFPTALVAENLHGPGQGHDHGGPVATVTYGLVMIAMAAAFTGIWVYVVTHAAKLGASLPPETLRRSVSGFSLGGAAYVAGTVIGVWSPLAALIIFGLLAVYYLFEHLPSPAPSTD